MTLRTISFLFFILTFILTHANGVIYQTDMETGAISHLKIENDPTDMNWIIATDGSQYDFIGKTYGWGLGYFTTQDGMTHQWSKYNSEIDGVLMYKSGDITICVNRIPDNDSIKEIYTFTNTGENPVTLTDIGIYTPFNDNYPNSEECVNKRCNAHIWNGGNSAYVYAVRMGGFGPHLGLVITDGNIENYEIWERGINKSNSQQRGVIALCPKDMVLKPGDTEKICWTIFPFNDKEEFIRKATKLGCLIPQSERYVVNVGETIELKYGDKSQYVKAEQPGEMRIELPYGNGKSTHAEFLAFENIDSLIQKRADFIIRHQRMMNKNDERYGAFMVYDNDGDSIYPNDTKNCNPVDRDEGAERIGMGVFLAKQYIANKTKNLSHKDALMTYADFIRNKLQTKEYVTFSSVDHKQRNRAYNYVWVADYYFLMHEITGDIEYAKHGYNTLRSMFSQFGHGFYAIGFPVKRSLDVLKKSGLENEYHNLLTDYMQIADTYIKNGINYPAHEVNYEQSIVAPAVQFLCEMYLLTSDSKYLNEAENQLPLVESFNGFQPSYHLNDIAIRHWDGYWFGKNEMFGDTFPHYWSTITAAVFSMYAKCTGKTEYQTRAENIVRNNLCLFSIDGKGSCAYLYPKRVNGEKAQFYDPFSNDQDWALAYWHQVMNGI